MPAAVKPKAKKMSRRNRLPRGMVRYSDVPDVVVRHEKQRQRAGTHVRARDRLIVDDQNVLRRSIEAKICASASQSAWEMQTVCVSGETTSSS